MLVETATSGVQNGSTSLLAVPSLKSETTEMQAHRRLFSHAKQEKLINLGSRASRTRLPCLASQYIITACLWPDLLHVNLGYHCRSDPVQVQSWTEHGGPKRPATRHEHCVGCRTRTHVSLNEPLPPFARSEGRKPLVRGSPTVHHLSRRLSYLSNTSNSLTRALIIGAKAIH